MQCADVQPLPPPQQTWSLVQWLNPQRDVVVPASGETHMA